MQGIVHTRKSGAKKVLYRCEVFRGRTVGPELADHPRTLSIAGDRLEAVIDQWIGTALSDPAWLASTQDADEVSPEVVTLRARKRDLESKIANLLSAIEGGAPPAVLVTQLNDRERELADVRARIGVLNRPAGGLTGPQITTLIAEVGGVAEALRGAAPSDKAALYATLGLRVVYDHVASVVTLEADLGESVDKWCPEGDLNPHAR